METLLMSNPRQASLPISSRQPNTNDRRVQVHEAVRAVGAPSRSRCQRNCEGPDTPVDLHRVVEAIEVVRRTQPLDWAQKQELRNASRHCRGFQIAEHLTHPNFGICLCWENEDRDVALLSAFVSKADGRSSLSAGFHELMDMIQKECKVDSAPALRFHIPIPTRDISRTSVERFVHKLERVATALAIQRLGCAVLVESLETLSDIGDCHSNL